MLIPVTILLSSPLWAPPSALEWTVSCPRKERWREVSFDIRQIHHLHISSVKCKASKLVSQRQWAARPFSEIERRLGPSSSLCDHGSMLYMFEIIWIIWFAWLIPDLLNRRSLTFVFRVQTLWSVCISLAVCMCAIACSCVCCSPWPLPVYHHPVLPYGSSPDSSQPFSCHVVMDAPGAENGLKDRTGGKGEGWRWLSPSYRTVSIHANASL